MESHAPSQIEVLDQHTSELVENTKAGPTFADMMAMAKVIADSRLFGIRDASQAAALMLCSQAEGKHPAAFLREYHIVDGRPSLRADAMLARFQQAGGAIEWHEMTDQQCRATFRHPQSSDLTLEWTIQQARNAKLAHKDNWRNYPRAMLRSRLISEGIRAVYPAVIAGLYTDEEVESFPRAAQAVEVQVDEPPSQPNLPDSTSPEPPPAPVRF